MPNREPEILTGTRGPRSERMESMRETESKAIFEPAQVAPRRFKDGTVYVSKFRRYRVQITSPADVTDPVTGRKVIGRPVVAKFDEGVWVNDIKDLAERARIDTYLQENPYFGKFGSSAEFWLASDQEETTKAAKQRSAKETLKALPPEAVAAFVREASDGEQRRPRSAPAGVGRLLRCNSTEQA